MLLDSGRGGLSVAPPGRATATPPAATTPSRPRISRSLPSCSRARSADQRRASDADSDPSTPTTIGQTADASTAPPPSRSTVLRGRTAPPGPSACLDGLKVLSRRTSGVATKIDRVARRGSTADDAHRRIARSALCSRVARTRRRRSRPRHRARRPSRTPRPRDPPRPPTRPFASSCRRSGHRAARARAAPSRYLCPDGPGGRRWSWIGRASRSARWGLRRGHRRPRRPACALRPGPLVPAAGAAGPFRRRRLRMHRGRRPGREIGDGHWKCTVARGRGRRIG